MCVYISDGSMFSVSVAHSYPFLPAGLAWLFATRSVFLYPELLPHCSLDPVLHRPWSKSYYTKGEDGYKWLCLSTTSRFIHGSESFYVL